MLGHHGSMIWGMMLPDLPEMLLFQESVETSKGQTQVDHTAGIVGTAVVTRMDSHHYEVP